MKNPFKHIRNWIKGELRRIGSLIEAISRWVSLEVRKNDTIRRVKDEKVTLAKLSSNSFVLGAMFKNKAVEQTRI